MFLFRDGLLTLMNIDSLISLERFCSSLPTMLVKLSSDGRMTCDVTMVKDRGGGFQMFFKPLSKCSSCLSYVLPTAFQPITFVSIDYTTLFCYVVFVFWCHQFIFYGFSTLEVNLDAISFTNVLEGFTESFIIRNSYVPFTDGLVVFVVAVAVVFWSTCLDFHFVNGPCRIFADC